MQVLHISKVSGLLKIPNSKQPIENEQKALRHELNQPTKCPADSASYYQEADFFLRISDYFGHNQSYFYNVCVCGKITDLGYQQTP